MINLLTSSKWHDSSPKIFGMERYINSRKWNSSKSSFKNKESTLNLKSIGNFSTLINNLSKFLLDFFNWHNLSQLSKINLLNFKKIKNVGKSLKSNEMTSNYVLLSFDIVAKCLGSVIIMK